MNEEEFKVNVRINMFSENIITVKVYHVETGESIERHLCFLAKLRTKYTINRLKGRLRWVARLNKGEL